MNLLLDTHGLLWFIDGDPKMSATARALIEDAGNEIYFSTASMWEIAIKVSIGKLPLSVPFSEIFPRQLAINDIRLLGITENHADIVSTLPINPNHKDPFDRLIIAQSMVENWPVVSVDEKFDSYPVTRLWE